MTRIEEQLVRWGGIFCFLAFSVVPGETADAQDLSADIEEPTGAADSTLSVVGPLPAGFCAEWENPASDACTNNGCVIDALVVYTDAARDGIGGLSTLGDKILRGVTNTNDALVAAGVQSIFRVVATIRVSYSTAGDVFTDFDRLRRANDGYLDEVHLLREQYGADLVILVTDARGPGIGGIGVMNGSAFPANAFIVLGYDRLADAAFPHEVGHVLGCRHDWTNDTGTGGAFPYSHGYISISGKFSTLMAYRAYPVQLVFSDPDVLYNGFPMGVPIGAACDPNVAPQSCPANNAASVRSTAATVARFRNSDCNSNGICDYNDVINGTSEDCDSNLRPDECQGFPDCNTNSVADFCDVAAGTSADCNGNERPDECDTDCNIDGVPDDCELLLGACCWGSSFRPRCTGLVTDGWCCVQSGIFVPRRTCGGVNCLLVAQP